MSSSVIKQDLGVFSKYLNSIEAAFANTDNRQIIGKYTLLNHQEDPVLDVKPTYKKIHFCVSQDETFFRVSIAALCWINHWQTGSEITIHSRLEKVDGVCHPRQIEKDALRCYLIFDLCNEDNLSKFLNSHFENLSSWQKDWLCYSIALTLMQCHEEGVIFRDLKCDNILVHQDAEGILKTEFTDFGMAIYDPEVTEDERRKNCGTADYFTPEQFSNLFVGKLFPRADFSVDLWAFGIISHAIELCEMYWDYSDIDKFIKKQKILPVVTDCSMVDFGPFSSEIRELLSIDPTLRPPAAWVAKRMGDIFLRTYPNSPVTERVRNRPKLTVDQVVDILRVVKTKLGGAIASKIASYLPSTAIGLENPKLTLDHVLLRLQELKK